MFACEQVKRFREISFSQRFAAMFSLYPVGSVSTIGFS